MGAFHVKVEAVGGHGCQRERGDGTQVEGCGLPGCPDCITRGYIKELQASGAQVSEATFTHWPGQEPEVRDDLLTGTRSGSF